MEVELRLLQAGWPGSHRQRAKGAPPGLHRTHDVAGDPTRLVTLPKSSLCFSSLSLSPSLQTRSGRRAGGQAGPGRACNSAGPFSARSLGREACECPPRPRRARETLGGASATLRTVPGPRFPGRGGRGGACAQRGPRMLRARRRLGRRCGASRARRLPQPRPPVQPLAEPPPRPGLRRCGRARGQTRPPRWRREREEPVSGAGTVSGGRPGAALARGPAPSERGQGRAGRPGPPRPGSPARAPGGGRWFPRERDSGRDWLPGRRPPPPSWPRGPGRRPLPPRHPDRGSRLARRRISCSGVRLLPSLEAAADWASLRTRVRAALSGAGPALRITLSLRSRVLSPSPGPAPGSHPLRRLPRHGADPLQNSPDQPRCHSVPSSGLSWHGMLQGLEQGSQTRGPPYNTLK